MVRFLALVALCSVAGCSGGDDSSGECHTLSESACGEREDCLPLMAHDVTTESTSGGTCWRGPTGDWGDPVYLRCVLRPGMMSGDIRFAASPDDDRCYAFSSGTLVPSGWRECMDVLPECTCRSDANCPAGEGCILYGALEQRCRPPHSGEVACTYDDFPVTGDRCPESERTSGTVCRPYFCDSGCAPTCTCTLEGTWSCDDEVCVAGTDAGTSECGTPPRCSATCL